MIVPPAPAAALVPAAARHTRRDHPEGAGLFSTRHVEHAQGAFVPEGYG